MKKRFTSAGLRRRRHTGRIAVEVHSLSRSSTGRSEQNDTHGGTPLDHGRFPSTEPISGARTLLPRAVETNEFAEDNADIPTIWERGRALSAVASRGNYVRADNNDHDASHEHDGN
jgi:hypothetical protein